MTVYWQLAHILWHLLLIHGGQVETPHTCISNLLRERERDREREREIYPVAKEITGHAAESGEH
jgi:hypothetical protein